MLTDITPENDIYREELFGPAAQVYRVPSEEEAVALANDTPFGLGSYVMTNDPEQAERVADRIPVPVVDQVIAANPKPVAAWTIRSWPGTGDSGPVWP